MEGWLYKKGAIGFGGEKKRWCVLEEKGSQGVLRYYGKPDLKSLKGSIKLAEMTDVEEHGDATFDVACKNRVFHLRAETVEDAKRWATYLRAKSQGVPAASPVDDDREVTGSPWLVDGVWLDGNAPAPIRMVADLGHLEGMRNGQHCAHVRLADGSTFSVDGLTVGGAGKEVAAAGEHKLLASIAEGPTLPLAAAPAAAAAPTSPRDASAAAAALAGACVLLCARVPAVATRADALAVALLAYAAVAALARAAAARRAAAPPPGGYGALAATAPSATYALVLKSLSPEKVAKKRRCSSHAAIEPSLLPTAVGAGLPAVAEEAGVDFSGSYALDVAASDNPTEMLAALGVSWAFRKAISKFSRTVHIEHDHDAWTETTVAPGVTRTTHLDLSGAPTVEISPVDKSAVTITASVQGDAVVSTSAYPPGSGKAQHISRTLEGGGARYVVVNTLTVGDREIKVRSVFNRVAHD